MRMQGRNGESIPIRVTTDALAKVVAGVSFALVLATIVGVLAFLHRLLEIVARYAS